ncbi:hypothetical protein F2Q69_00061934 [Brassica cretica]|uniref:Uncharacterized protein n=1 Tax=Brassica cretica TaxID=69181 RepID=A0A8S9RB79_BRACR|nr:hypothetical protein F2Q69_00061934 [Brassica cretica]
MLNPYSGITVARHQCCFIDRQSFISSTTFFREADWPLFSKTDRTDQTDRTVPRASRLELRLEPRPDDLTDRTTARLPRPTRHFKTHGRARLSLGREETKDGHAFLSGGPSGQSRKRPYLYPVHPSGSDEPGQ